MIVGLALSALLLAAVPEAGTLAPGLGTLHHVQDGEAAPAPAPARPRRRAPRRPGPRRFTTPPLTAIQPLPGPAPAPSPQVEVAPMPNRSLEAPRGPAARDAARLRPDLIEPRNLPDGRQQQGNNFTERQDRLFRDPAYGARLEIPFSY